MPPEMKPLQIQAPISYVRTDGRADGGGKGFIFSPIKATVTCTINRPPMRRRRTEEKEGPASIPSLPSWPPSTGTASPAVVSDDDDDRSFASCRVAFGGPLIPPVPSLLRSPLPYPQSPLRVPPPPPSAPRDGREARCVDLRRAFAINKRR